MAVCSICDRPGQLLEVLPGRFWCETCQALPEDERRQLGLVKLGLMERAENPEPFWHYLSFVVDGKFAGVCWVEARGMLDATRVARARGCNPGGEVACVPLPKHGEPPAGSAYVLHKDRAEIDRMCEAWPLKESG